MTNKNSLKSPEMIEFSTTKPLRRNARKPS
jgi:hypothetical protein